MVAKQVTKIRAIIFDCYGVLYTPLGEDYFRTRLKDYDRFAAAIENLRAQANYGLITREQLHTALHDLTGIDLSVPVHSGWFRNQPLLDYIEQLRATYKVGMLSNISMRTIDDFFPSTERRTLFDDAIISSEVGLIKPYPAIYLLAADRLGVMPAEAVMIDDTIVNCDGARQAGMQAIVYTTFEAMKRELDSLLQRL
jgi:FMN phosphatase YigB (HAD superfamily)